MVLACNKIEIWRAKNIEQEKSVRFNLLGSGEKILLIAFHESDDFFCWIILYSHPLCNFVHFLDIFCCHLLHKLYFKDQICSKKNYLCYKSVLRNAKRKLSKFSRTWVCNKSFGQGWAKIFQFKVWFRHKSIWEKD